MSELLAFLIIICGSQGVVDTYGAGSNWSKKVHIESCMKKHICMLKAVKNEVTYSCRLKKAQEVVK